MNADSNPRGRRYSKEDQLQVFVGNIPNDAKDDDIRMMFLHYGRMTRFRVHEHPTKRWLPRYAFITYEHIDSARECLNERVSVP